MNQNLKLFCSTLLKLLSILSFCSLMLSLFVDSRFLTDQIESNLKNISGIHWNIIGPVRFTMLSGPGIEIRGILIEQPDGFKSPEALLKIKRLNFRLDIIDLFKGYLKLKRVEVHSPRVYAKANKKGENSLLQFIEMLESGKIEAPIPETLLQPKYFISLPEGDGELDSPEIEALFNSHKKTENLNGQTNDSANDLPNDSANAQATESKQIEDIISYLRNIEIDDASFYFEENLKTWLKVSDADLKITLPNLRKKEAAKLIKAELKTQLSASSRWLDVADAPNIDLNIESRCELNFVPQKDGWNKLPFDLARLWLRVISDKEQSRADSVLGKARLELTSSLDFKNGQLEIPSLEINADGASANGHVDVHNIFSSVPSTKADLEVHNFSLTRWLGFARRLPNGLQHTLNKASGKVFVLGLGSHFSFDAPNIEAAGTNIKGKATVPDFAKPSLNLELWTDYVDVNNVIPELAPADAKHGYIEPAPLNIAASLPFPTDPDSPEAEELEFPFEVIINVKEAKVNLFHAHNVQTKIFQNKEKDTVVIAADIGNIYGGKGTVQLDIDKNIDLKVDLQDANTEEPSVLLFSDIRSAGKMNLFFEGILIGRILKGDINARTNQPLTITLLNTEKNGSQNKDFVLPFSAIQVQGKNFSFERVNRDMKIQGNLVANAKGPFQIGGINFDFIKVPSANLRQAIYMNMDSRDWTGLEQIDLNANAKGSIEPFARKLPLDVNLKGLLGIKLDKKGVNLNRMNFEGFDANIKGELKTEQLWGNSNDTLYESNLHFQSSKLLSFLEKFGIKENLGISTPRHPEALTKADFKGYIYAKGDVLNIKDLKGIVDTTDFTLNLDKKALNPKQTSNGQASNGQRSPSSNPVNNINNWNINFECGSLNADNYRPPEGLVQKKAKDWDLSGLYSNKISANIKAKHLRFINLDFKDLQIPINSENGKIVAKPIKGTLYSGVIKSDFYAELLNKTLSSQLKLETEKSNFAQLVTSIAGKRFAEGEMKLSLNLLGKTKSLDDLPSGLSGNWNIDIANGRYYTEPEKVNDSGSSFSSSSSSGEITNGVINTNNFRLYSGLISMEGRAEADLNKKTIDSSINVMVVKGPTLPIRITGKLDAPKFSSSALKAIPTTVYKVTKGILTLPLRIFGYED